MICTMTCLQKRLAMTVSAPCTLPVCYIHTGIHTNRNYIHQDNCSSKTRPWAGCYELQQTVMFGVNGISLDTNSKSHHQNCGIQTHRYTVYRNVSPTHIGIRIDRNDRWQNNRTIKTTNLIFHNMRHQKSHQVIRKLCSIEKHRYGHPRYISASLVRLYFTT